MSKNIKPIGSWTIMGKEFTVYGSEKKPLLLAKDVAEWIEYDSNKVNEMVAMVDCDEKLTETISWSGQGRKMWFLTEDGLYEILMMSRKPFAKKFKKEVKRILKHLRDHGEYVVKEKDKQWNQIRLEGKDTRKLFTDAVKDFVEYAQAQGSQNYKRYYAIFTNLINNRLGVPADLDRDELSDIALKQLERYEMTISNYIGAKISQKMPYKEIYSECKSLINQI